MRENQRKSLLLCILAFTAGLLLVVSLGCSVEDTEETENSQIQPIETYDLIFPITEYDIESVA